ncbi:hypothetical protein ACPV5V_26675, partial [Vibrio campbellii]
LVTEQRQTNEDFTPVVVSDFSEQDGQLYAWFGAPIVQQGYLHSYALFRLPNNAITKLMANQSNEKAVKTLIVGEDYLSRTMAYSQDDIQNSLQVIAYALEGLTNVG